MLLLLNHTSINALVKVSSRKAFQLKIPFFRIEIIKDDIIRHFCQEKPQNAVL